MSKLLTAAELMAASPPTIDVDAWGGKVRLARLEPTAKLEIALAASQLTKDDKGKVQMLDPHNWAFAVDLVAASIVDGEGTLQFAEPGPKAWLAGEISAVSSLLGDCMRLNGLGEAEQAADLEAAEKN